MLGKGKEKYGTSFGMITMRLAFENTTHLELDHVDNELQNIQRKSKH
jgi:hypothetical protein